MDAKQLAAALRKQLALSPPVTSGLPKRLFQLFVDRAAEWIVRGLPTAELPLFTHGALLSFAQQLEAKGKLPTTNRTRKDTDKRKKQLGDNITAALTELTKRLRALPFARPLDDGENFLLSFPISLGTERVVVEVVGLLSKNRSGFGFPDDPRIGLLARIPKQRILRRVVERRFAQRAVGPGAQRRSSPEVSVVYAEGDLELRRRLEKHVNLLVHAGVVAIWNDLMVLSDEPTATNPEPQNTAAVVVILVSPILAESDYFYSSQFLETLRRYENAELALVPVLTRVFEWRTGPLASVELPVLDELATSPSQHTDDALNEIARHIRSLLDEIAEHAPNLVLHCNLPQRRNVAFTGRDALLRALEMPQSADATRPRIDVLTGLGGIGKSHISIELAYRVFEACDVIWWVRGNDEATILADYRALSVALALAGDSTPTPEAVARVQGWLEVNDRWMLILDNAETPETVARYLPRIGGGRIVVTSLNPAWRTIGTVHQIEQFSEAEAISFLQCRSGATASGASDLAEELGYLPLALELAAAYIDAIATDYAAYLALYRAHRRQLLRQNDSHLSPVVTTWQLSIERVRTESSLAVDVLNLSARLASAPIPRVVFEYWFDRGVLSNALLMNTKAGHDRKTPLEIANAVRALRRYSLVNARSADIIVHRLLRDCICSTAEGKEQHEFEVSALGVIAELFKNEAFHYHTSDLAAALLPHVRVVTTPHLLATSTSAVYLMSLLARFLDEHGSFAEAATVLEEAERRCNSGSIDEYIALTVRTKLAAVYRVMHRGLDAMAAIERALKLAAKLSPINGEEVVIMAEFLNTLAVFALEGGDSELGVSLLQKALRLLKRQDLEPGILALTHANLGGAFSKLGRHDQAIEQLRLATETNRATFGNSHPRVAQSLGILGAAYRNAHRFAEARDAYDDAWQIHVTAHGRKHPVTLHRLADLAQVYLILGDVRAAFESYNEVLAIALSVGWRATDVAALRNQRAVALAHLGRFDEALTDVNAAIGLARDEGGQLLRLCEQNREDISAAAERRSG